MKRLAFVQFIALSAVSLLGLQACGEPPQDYGPQWRGRETTPPFTILPNDFSTTFSGNVYPQTDFVFGAAEGFSMTGSMLKLTVVAGDVWAYAPIYVELYDGPRDQIGSEATLITKWEIPTPDRGRDFTFENIRPLPRIPNWVVVRFPDFAGDCVVQLLGYQ